jgi:uncharacterized protein
LRAQQTCTATEACLDWQDNATNEQGFKINRKLNAGAYQLSLFLVGANVVSYKDTSLVRGATEDNNYCYTVTAYNANGDSAPSNEGCKIVVALAKLPPGSATNLIVK